MKCTGKVAGNVVVRGKDKLSEESDDRFMEVDDAVDLSGFTATDVLSCKCKVKTKIQVSSTDTVRVQATVFDPVGG